MRTPCIVPLACPACHVLLNTEENFLICPSCKHKYPIRGGIPCFDGHDDLYEGRFTQTVYHKGKRPWSTKGLRTSLTKRARFFRRHIPKGSLILDLGCGGGNTFFNPLGTVVGIDISLSSVSAAQTVYDQITCGNILRLPFLDNTFDRVVSENVVEHVSPKDKDVFFREIYRVTKPGGATVHTITVEGDNSFTNFAKRHPSLYRRYFMDVLGHCGLESPFAAVERFEKAGFQAPQTVQAYTSWIRPLEEYLSKLDNEYKEAEPEIKGFLSLANLIQKKYPFRLLRKPVRGLITVTKALVDSCASFGKGDLIYVCCTK